MRVESRARNSSKMQWRRGKTENSTKQQAWTELQVTGMRSSLSAYCKAIYVGAWNRNYGVRNIIIILILSTIVCNWPLCAHILANISTLGETCRKRITVAF
jgi:hypothetical protein